MLAPSFLMYHRLAMYPAMPMHEMSKLEFIVNNPEWVTVLTSSLFAIVTLCIIWRQKSVMQQQAQIMVQQKEIMRVQAETSARHERQQNRLIQLQHEHDWLTALNVKREEVLATAEKLHIDTLFVINGPFVTDMKGWSDLQHGRAKLKLQLDVLDVAAYLENKDDWHAQLMNWCAALFNVISEDYKVNKSGTPTMATRVALKELDKVQVPTKAMVAIRKAIRTDTDTFKKR
jgi:hypothetical protein